MWYARADHSQARELLSPVYWRFSEGFDAFDLTDCWIRLSGQRIVRNLGLSRDLAGVLRIRSTVAEFRLPPRPAWHLA
jgi:hypothetical protein